jgi:hypothetical protein
MGMNEVSRSWIAAWSFAPTIGSTELVIEGAVALRLTQKGTRKMAAAPRQASSMVAEKSIGNRSLRSKTLLVACHAERLNQRNTKLGRGPTKVLGLFEVAKRNSAHGPGVGANIS